MGERIKWGRGTYIWRNEAIFLDDPVYSEPNNSSVQLDLKNNIIARKKEKQGEWVI